MIERVSAQESDSLQLVGISDSLVRQAWPSVEVNASTRNPS